MPGFSIDPEFRDRLQAAADRLTTARGEPVATLGLRAEPVDPDYRVPGLPWFENNERWQEETERWWKSGPDEPKEGFSL